MLISRRLNPPLRVRMLAVLSEERRNREKGGGKSMKSRRLPADGRADLTFPVNHGEVGVGGTDGEDELVPHLRFVRVHGADRLNQLHGEEERTSLFQPHPLGRRRAAFPVSIRARFLSIATRYILVIMHINITSCLPNPLKTGG